MRIIRGAFTLEGLELWWNHLCLKWLLQPLQAVRFGMIFKDFHGVVGLLLLWLKADGRVQNIHLFIEYFFIILLFGDKSELLNLNWKILYIHLMVIIERNQVGVLLCFPDIVVWNPLFIHIWIHLEKVGVPAIRHPFQHKIILKPCRHMRIPISRIHLDCPKSRISILFWISEGWRHSARVCAITTGSRNRVSLLTRMYSSKTFVLYRATHDPPMKSHLVQIIYFGWHKLTFKIWFIKLLLPQQVNAFSLKLDGFVHALAKVIKLEA